jgi:hypothetical protein
VVRTTIETSRSDSYLKPHNGLILKMQYFSRDNSEHAVNLQVGKLMPRVYRDED